MYRTAMSTEGQWIKDKSGDISYQKQIPWKDQIQQNTGPLNKSKAWNSLFVCAVQFRCCPNTSTPYVY